MEFFKKPIRRPSIGSNQGYNMQLQYGDAPRKSEIRHASRSEQLLATPLTAQLTGSHRCEALGIVAKGHAPAFALCRQLLTAGVNPDTALSVYRNGILALKVRSIGEAARLAAEDSKNGRPQFRLARPTRRGAAPPMRKTGTGA